MALKHDFLGSVGNPDSSDDPLVADTESLGNGISVQSHGMVAGQTVQQWTADWWNWAVHTPSTTPGNLPDANPLTDTTGALAGVDNSGPMFFIAGTAGGTASREFDVPAGKPLLVPLINLLDNAPDPKSLMNQYFSDPTILGWKHSVSDLILNIDGDAVGNLQTALVQTDFFSLGPVQPGSTGTELWGINGVDVEPAKAIGYWEVIKGFAPGSTHTIDFGGSSNFGGPVLVHDTIHVV